MENNLTFISSQSIAEFKASLGIQSLNVCTGKSGKPFMVNPTTGKTLGPVTYQAADAIISKVADEEGIEFFLMHKRPEFKVVATF